MAFKANTARDVTHFGLPPDHPEVWRIVVEDYVFYSLTEPTFDAATDAHPIDGTGALGLHFKPVPVDAFAPGSIATSRTWVVAGTVLVNVLYIPAKETR